jgi:hypothetical protein
MKTELLFAVASLMLVGAVLVFALPSPVQATKGQPVWAITIDGQTYGYKNKGLCQQRTIEAHAHDQPVEVPCHIEG